MASQTIESYQTSIVDEQVEQKVKEDHEKTSIQESLSLSSSKEGEEESTKAENSPRLTTASPETKAAEDKHIEPHVAGVLKAADPLELDVQKAESDGSSSFKESAQTFSYQTQPISESEGQQNNKLIEPPAVEVDEAVDAPKSNVPPTDEKAVPEEEKPRSENLTSVVEVEKIVDEPFNLIPPENIVGKESLTESETPIAPKPVAETVENQTKNLVISETIDNVELKQEVEEKGQEEQLNMEDALEPSVQATEKPTVQLDVTAAQDSEVTVVKEHGDSKPRGEEEEETPGKPLEHEQEEEKGDKFDSEEKENNVVLKAEESLSGKIEHPTDNVAQSSTIKTWEEVSIDHKAESDAKEISSLPTVMEKLVTEEEKKEVGETELTKNKAEAKMVDVVETSIAKNAEGDEDERSNAITHDSTHVAMEEGINRSISTSEVTKNSFKGTDEDEIATTAQSQKDEQKEETIAVKETLEEYQETARTDALKPEEEKVVNVAKSDSNIAEETLECCKVEETIAVKETLEEYQETARTDAMKPEEEKVENVAKSDSNIAEGTLECCKVEETIAAKETVEEYQETARTDALKLEEENVAKSDSNIEPLATDGESTKPEHTPIYTEAIKHENKEVNQDEVVTAFNETVIKKAEKPLSEVKEEETVNNEAHKAEKEQLDNFDLKSSKDLPKEIPAKTIQKQSNSIILKLKHSFVKAKKAILGKSPRTKTIVSQAKSHIEVK